MVGKLSVGDQIRTTHIRLRKITDNEAYITSIEERYGAKDSILNVMFTKSTLHNLT